MDVAIIDYGMSNLHSVKSACKHVGLSTIVTSDKNHIMGSKIAILPGVGAFGEAMHQLKKTRLDKCIRNFVATGKPFIGICLGLQLLFDRSEEFGSSEGLGLIGGSVKKFRYSEDKKNKYTVPHIGWNKINKVGDTWEGTALNSNYDEDFMYFVHSYYVEPNNSEVVIANTTYGKTVYCSAVRYENIFATQFHPEKSGILGLKIYKELKRMIK